MKRASSVLAVGLIIVLIGISGCGRKKANQAFTRGTVFLQQQKYDEARAEYEEALRLHSKHHQAHYGLGVIDMTEAKYQSALERFDRAIELKDDFSGPYYQKARTYAMLDNPAEALNALETAVMLEPKWSQEAANDKVLAKLKSNPRFSAIIAN